MILLKYFIYLVNFLAQLGTANQQNGADMLSLNQGYLTRHSYEETRSSSMIPCTVFHILFQEKKFFKCGVVSNVKDSINLQLVLRSRSRSLTRFLAGAGDALKFQLKPSEKRNELKLFIVLCILYIFCIINCTC